MSTINNATLHQLVIATWQGCIQEHHNNATLQGCAAWKELLLSPAEAGALLSGYSQQCLTPSCLHLDTDTYLQTQALLTAVEDQMRQGKFLANLTSPVKLPR